MKRSVKIFVIVAIIFVVIFSINQIARHNDHHDKRADNTDEIMRKLVAEDKECTDQLYSRLINMRHSDPETYDVVTEIARVKGFDNCDYVEFLKHRTGGQQQK